jgi:hypothetical protein
MDPLSTDTGIRGISLENRAPDLETATMPNLEDATARKISAVAHDRDHPFAKFVLEEVVAIRNSFNRFGVGAVVTGVQTGTDSAAVAIAKDLGIPLTGFAPRGYINEDGPLSAELQAKMLQPQGLFTLCDETTIGDQEKLPVGQRNKIYAERTELNAKYSSATLIINPGQLEGGTLLTVECVLRHHQPNQVFIIDPTREPERQIREAREWIRREKPLFLNIAGPRQSHSLDAGIDVFEESLKTLRGVLA